MIVEPAMTDVIGPIVRHHGEPFADSSAVAMYYLARMTREHVTVALSGDAADEVFAGYKRYGPARLGHVYDALPPVVRWLYRGVVRAALHFPAPFTARYAAAFPLGEATRYASLVDPAYVGRLVTSLERESANVDRIWTLLMLELWFREFIDGPRSMPRPPVAP
jgi:asparagine synthetase B (glutamine-hydrolysing)